ncbi:hypothetical protein [Blastomonas sp.]|uniref:hypothetical protein n=1 Tax=Blastomonas sp. TaxID=1909299 RepID=UPI003594015F
MSYCTPGLWRVAMLGALVTLGGCGGTDPDSSQQTDTPSVERGAMVAQVPETTPNLSTIPARFQGQWSLSDNRCAEEVAKDYLVIKPTALEFWETRGAVTKVSMKGNDALILNLDFEGEGTNWQGKETLTLIDADTKLTRTGGEGDSAAIYWRCGR